MKRSLLLLSLILSFFLAKSQNWTKISGITDSTRIFDLASINDKVIVSGTSFNATFPVIAEYFISNDGGNNWSATSTIEFGAAVVDALPINNIFTTYGTIIVQSQQLTGNTWSNFSNKSKFAEFSNGTIIGGAAGGADTVYNISSTGVVGSKINSSKFNFGLNGDYFEAANNRMFFFRNSPSGLYGGDFSYIDLSDLSSFKTPLTLDGNAMTAIDWKNLVGVTDVIMMNNGDLLATSAELGLIKSIDNGINWTSLNNLFGGAGNVIYKNSVGHLYALIGFGAVGFSTDGGLTFTNITANLPAGSLKEQLFVNSQNEVFVFLNNNTSSSADVDYSGIYKLDGTSSISNLSKLTQFEVYPNPTSGIFTFKSISTSNVAVSVINLMGSTILNFTTQDLTSTIDLSNQAAGVYFLQATVNGRTQTQKLIVQ